MESERWWLKFSQDEGNVKSILVNGLWVFHRQALGFFSILISHHRPCASLLCHPHYIWRNNFQIIVHLKSLSRLLLGMCSGARSLKPLESCSLGKEAKGSDIHYLQLQDKAFNKSHHFREDRNESKYRLERRKFSLVWCFEWIWELILSVESVGLEVGEVEYCINHVSFLHNHDIQMVFSWICVNLLNDIL